LYIFTFIETIKYISFHLKIPFQRIFSEKQIGNTISFSIIDGLDSAAQFLAASCQQSPDIDLLHDIPWRSCYPAAVPNYR